MQSLPYEVPDRLEKIRAMMAAFLMAGAGIGMLSGLSGVFIKAVCADTGLSRASFSSIGAISTIVSAFAAYPAAGVLSGKNIRKAVAVGAAICGTVPILYSLSSQQWQFWCAAVINGLFIDLVTMLAVGILVSRSLESSTAATGAAFAAAGLFTAVFTPVADLAIKTLGWRMAWAITGILAGGILLFASAVIPSSVAQKRKKRHSEVQSKGKSEISAAAAVFTANFCNLAMFNHALAFLTDIGYASAAASVVSAVSLLAAAARMGMGIAYSRLGALRGTRILSLSLAVCALSALDLPGSGTLTLYTIALALSATASSLPAKALSTDENGELDGKRFARLTKFSSLGSALGSPASGAVFDLSGSYRAMWKICLLLSVLSLLLFSRTLTGREKTEL